MGIKEQLEAIIEMAKLPSKKIDKAQFAAKMMQLLADMTADSVVIPEDVFQSLDNDGRFMALHGMLIILMASMNS